MKFDFKQSVFNSLLTFKFTFLTVTASKLTKKIKNATHTSIAVLHTHAHAHKHALTVILPMRTLLNVNLT